MCDEVFNIERPEGLRISIDEASNEQPDVCVIGIFSNGGVFSDCNEELLLALNAIGASKVILIAGPVLPSYSADTDKVEYTHAGTFKNDEHNIFNKMADEFDKMQKQMELDIDMIAKLCVEYEKIELDEKPINYETRLYKLPSKLNNKLQRSMMLKRTGCRGK